MAGIINVSASFTTATDAAAYASGDLIANSATPGSVTPLSFAVGVSQFRVLRARVKLSLGGGSGFICRLHLYSSSPTVTNGDNGAWLSTESGWLGSVACLTHSVTFNAPDGVAGCPEVGTASFPLPMAVALPSGTTVYGLLEARNAFSMAAASVATVTLEVERP